MYSLLLQRYARVHVQSCPYVMYSQGAQWTTRAYSGKVATVSLYSAYARAWAHLHVHLILYTGMYSPCVKATRVG